MLLPYTAAAANAALVAEEERLEKEDLPAYAALVERNLAAQTAELEKLKAAAAAAAAQGGGGRATPRARLSLGGGGGGGSPPRASPPKAAVGGGGSAAAAAASPSSKNKGGRTMEGLMPPEIEAGSREEQIEWCYNMWTGMAMVTKGTRRTATVKSRAAGQRPTSSRRCPRSFCRCACRQGQ